MTIVERRGGSKMAKNQKRTLIVTIIVFIAFSVVAITLPFKKNGVFWLSYVFSAFAILVQLYVLKMAFSETENVKSKFYGFPIAQIGIVYMGIQVVVSIIFMVLAFITPIWIPIIVDVLLLAAAAIGLISTDAMRDEIERQDVKLEIDTSCMTTLRSVVYALPGKVDDNALKSELQNLADEFKYSDPVSGNSLKDIETELEQTVRNLQSAVFNNQIDAVRDLVKKSRNILSERNRLCKLNKKK